MNFIENNLTKWVCPSDRELTLRAKLRSGWSSRTHTDSVGSISENEQAIIAQVLERASKAEELENERKRRLNDKLEKIRKQACGNGKKSCILCNDQQKFFSKFYTCKDCRNSVCSKCSVDTHELDSDSTVWLCKICSESREVMKKTNLWIHL